MSSWPRAAAVVAGSPRGPPSGGSDGLSPLAGAAAQYVTGSSPPPRGVEWAFVAAVDELTSLRDELKRTSSERDIALSLAAAREEAARREGEAEAGRVRAELYGALAGVARLKTKLAAIDEATATASGGPGADGDTAALSAERKRADEAEARAAEAADLLVKASAEGGEVLLLAHGYFNNMIGIALQRRGWKLTQDQGFRYWSVRRFEPRG